MFSAPRFARPHLQRNYAVDNIIVATANTPWPQGFDNITGARPLQADLYMAMLGSALYVKSSIEGRKSSNSFGCIIWCARATRMS